MVLKGRCFERTLFLRDVVLKGHGASRLPLTMVLGRAPLQPCRQSLRDLGFSPEVLTRLGDIPAIK